MSASAIRTRSASVRAFIFRIADAAINLDRDLAKAKIARHLFVHLPGRDELHHLLLAWVKEWRIFRAERLCSPSGLRVAPRPAQSPRHGVEHVLRRETA